MMVVEGDGGRRRKERQERWKGWMEGRGLEGKDKREEG